MKNSLPVGAVAQKRLCLSSLLGESGGWWERAQSTSRVWWEGNHHTEVFGIKRLIIFPDGNRTCQVQGRIVSLTKNREGSHLEAPQISIFACPCISHSGKFEAIWTDVITWCFCFCFCFWGIKLNLLNKEVYGYMLQPSGASKTLKDMRISFTHVKLEWFGKSGRL